MIVGILGVFFLTPLRYYNPPLEGAGGYSDDIKESKERGVFLFEYEVKDNPLRLQNGRIIHFQQAWAEKAWTYPLFSNQTDIDDPPLYSICITVTKEDIADYPHDGAWWIGDSPDTCFYRSNQGQLSLGRKRFLPQAFETFIIHKGENPYLTNNKTDILGVLTLKRR